MSYWFWLGLIFFLFVLYFTNFMYQKTIYNLTNRFYLVSLIAVPSVLFTAYALVTNNQDSLISNNNFWPLLVSYTNFYVIKNTYEVSDLAIIRELYFTLNTFEFFLINFSLFFGLVTAIILYFSIKSMLTGLTIDQLTQLSRLNALNTNFFIRSQDFLKQKITPSFTYIWKRK